MSVPKKPVSPVSPRGPIKPVARPTVGAAKKGAAKSITPVKKVTPVKKAEETKVEAKVEKPIAKAAEKKTSAVSAVPKKEDAKKDIKPTVAKKEASASKVDGDKKPPKVDANKGGDAESKKKKFGFLDFMFLFVVVALVGTNVYVHHIGKVKYDEVDGLYQGKVKEVEDLKLKSDELRAEIDKQGEQLKDFRVSNSEKDAVIADKEALNKIQSNKITSLQRRINSLSNRKDFDKSTIDSLAMALNALNQQVLSLSKSNEIKALEIQTLKRQIAEGGGSAKLEELKASDITITAYEEKKGESVESVKSKKVTKIEVMFFLDEDEDIKAGLKTIYFSIEDAEGNVIGTNGTVTLKGDGSSVDYSFDGHVDYPLSGLETKTWIKSDDVKLKKGSYTMNLYSKDMLIGSRAFELK